jgi:2-C-methyl-D-erythritol 4-phosphate cytidylyltransferase
MGGRLAVIVAAGGTGERLGRSGGKQLAPILGRPLLYWTLKALAAPPVDLIVVVCHPDRVREYEEAAIEPLGLGEGVLAVAGGDTRQDSVARGLAAVPESFEYVAVHDGARPLVSHKTLSAAVDRLGSAGIDGVVAGHPCYDTLKEVEGVHVVDTPDRSRFWIAQTPQVFSRETLVEAHKRADNGGFVGTDDASLVEYAGGLVEMIEAPRDNIKVTTSADLRLFEAALRDSLEAERA